MKPIHRGPRLEVALPSFTVSSKAAKYQRRIGSGSRPPIVARRLIEAERVSAAAGFREAPDTPREHLTVLGSVHPLGARDALYITGVTARWPARGADIQARSKRNTLQLFPPCGKGDCLVPCHDVAREVPKTAYAVGRVAWGNKPS